MATINSLLKFTAQELAKRTQMKLLWTNASPESSFSSQTISLDLSGYSHIMVETSDQYYQIIRVGKAKSIEGSGYITDSVSYTILHARRVATSSNSVTIGNNYVKWANSTSCTVANNNLVPCKIYGIKGVS